MTFLKDWNFWLSLITSLVAIIALFQTAHQTKLNNKQHLFDYRLKAYTKAKGLVDLCRKNYSQLLPKNNDKPFFENDLIFTWLTNNTYMYQQVEALKHPLKQSYQLDFLKKCEELECLSEEFELYFKGEAATQFRNFVCEYKNTLFSMYQYQIILDKMNKLNNEQHMAIEKAQNFSYEPEQRKKLYVSFRDLKNTYDILINKKADEKIKKQLTLK